MRNRKFACNSHYSQFFVRHVEISQLITCFSTQKMQIILILLCLFPHYNFDSICDFCECSLEFQQTLSCSVFVDLDKIDDGGKVNILY